MINWQSITVFHVLLFFSLGNIVLIGTAYSFIPLSSTSLSIVSFVISLHSNKSQVLNDIIIQVLTSHPEKSSFYRKYKMSMFIFKPSQSSEGMNRMTKQTESHGLWLYKRKNINVKIRSLNIYISDVAFSIFRFDFFCILSEILLLPEAACCLFIFFYWPISLLLIGRQECEVMILCVKMHSSE